MDATWRAFNRGGTCVVPVSMRLDSTPEEAEALLRQQIADAIGVGPAAPWVEYEGSTTQYGVVRVHRLRCGLVHQWHPVTESVDLVRSA